MKKLISLLLMLMLAPNFCLAGPQVANTPRTVPTVTLLVKIFSELENSWIDAVQNKDMVTLNDIVSADFEMRGAVRPGQPTPREEFINHSLKDAPFTSTIGQMAAHEFGDVVIVSFMWKLDVAKASPLPQQIFVVDTWKKIDNKWQVVVRYASPVTTLAKNVPGAEVVESPIKKKI
jgi:ketosteroid isomerase-like protein